MYATVPTASSQISINCSEIVCTFYIADAMKAPGKNALSLQMENDERWTNNNNKKSQNKKV